MLLARMLYGLTLLPCLISTALGDASAYDEDFEAKWRPERWSFSKGPEFPGAEGSFERSPQAAHTGQFGGRLAFDFRGGGNYVAAVAAAGQCSRALRRASLAKHPGRPWAHTAVHRPDRSDIAETLVGAGWSLGGSVGAV